MIGVYSYETDETAAECLLTFFFWKECLDGFLLAFFLVLFALLFLVLHLQIF